MAFPIRLLLPLLGSALLSAGCAGFRSSMMDWRNADLVGEVAPPVEGEDWTAAGPWVDVAARDAEWTLVAFLVPW